MFSATHPWTHWPCTAPWITHKHTHTHTHTHAFCTSSRWEEILFCFMWAMLSIKCGSAGRSFLGRQMIPPFGIAAFTFRWKQLDVCVCVCVCEAEGRTCCMCSEAVIICHLMFGSQIKPLQSAAPDPSSKPTSLGEILHVQGRAYKKVCVTNPCSPSWGELSVAKKSHPQTLDDMLGE